MRKTIEERIDDAYEALAVDKPRRYIGASIVGNDCNALLALSLRGFPDNPVPPRIKRIFQDGHAIELVIIRDLRMAGLTIEEVDTKTGKQFEFHACGGHVLGHCDGIISDKGIGRHTILEAKSMNNNKFELFSEVGVKHSHPMYYAQVQLMMGLSGFQRSLIVAYNKNNSMYKAEEVEFKPFYYSYLLTKIDIAMNGEAVRVSKDRADWRCKTCFKHDSCWELNKVEPSCETCMYSKPVENREWMCTYKGIDKVFAKPCENYKRYIPLTQW